MKQILLFLGLLAFASATAVAELGKDSTHDDVVAQFGKPSSEVKQGAVTTMVYPKGTVRLRDGKVTEVSSQLYATGGNANGSGGLRMPGTAGGGKITKKGSARLDLATVLVKDRITVVDFYADWCGPCRRLAPLLEDVVQQDPDVYLCKVNIKDFGSPVAEQFQLRSIPHVRVYGRDGKQVGQGSSALETIKVNIATAKAAGAPAAAN